MNEGGKTSVTRAEITAGLRRIGLGAGDIALVHSSLSSFGHVEGGAEAVIEALLEAVRPGGTILMPTLTGSEKLSADNPPIFNPVSDPCWTGRIPETFRKRSDAIRSLHPTHSVALVGPDAERLAAGHAFCPTPCGVESPYGRLVEFGGKVVLLGVDHNSSTLFHHIEEVAELPYHLQERPALASILLPDGRRMQVRIRLHLYGPPRDFNRMEPTFEKLGVQRRGKIGKSEVRIVSARGMVAATLEALKSDPEILLKEGVHWP